MILGMASEVATNGHARRPLSSAQSQGHAERKGTLPAVPWWQLLQQRRQHPT